MKQEIRCAKCNTKLAEYDMSVGQIRIICHRSKCKTMNVIVVRHREKDEPENTLINLAQ